ncbi:Protein TolQ [Zhongshania aliphaticivorans]|uniref:Tol-Pal system protein TolQ n=1 Tax=Zhongshania aliphaticivorans TaxID=1470434 RepID=A0A5S9Q5F9_9GAMM|nr:protein TolQ [Zhongshania aliphaticivorans]CAA0094133.1 Protein TolQ [Zhongshania aliphaticivorans]CAA0112221.1 Protein TolQ [Zhongshania aliphaticivorans]
MGQELSIWQLVSQASVFVQLIMLILLLASVVSWYQIAQRMMYFGQAQKEMVRFESRFWSGTDLNTLYAEGSDKRGVMGMESVFRAGFKEFTRLAKKKLDSDAMMEACQRSMRVALSREEEAMESGLPFLATVGSTSPYVGLLGTVWGIMGSFHGLGQVQQATLATVAPGISEALVATAMGLIAAIPAVVSYNRFSAKVDSFAGKYETFSEEFSSILHRQIHSRD